MVKLGDPMPARQVVKIVGHPPEADLDPSNDQGLKPSPKSRFG